jgi:hypothetical protein
VIGKSVLAGGVFLLGGHVGPVKTWCMQFLPDQNWLVLITAAEGSDADAARVVHEPLRLG